MLDFIKHHIHIFETLCIITAEINIIKLGKLKVNETKFEPSIDIGNVLAVG